MYVTMGRRRRIAERNLSYCLPMLSDQARAKVLRAQFKELGVALVDSARAWHANPKKLREQCTVRGMQHVEAARQSGQGVLLVSGHFLALNMALQLASMKMKGYGVYRRNKNPILDYLILRGRERQGVRLFPHEDMRTPMRALRNRETVWFSPDQDQGVRQGAFVTFFGRPAATVTTVARLAGRTGASVVPLLYRRLAKEDRYELEFLPALDAFPGDDVIAATRRINAIIEQQALLAPSQYLWVHRRFKARPAGQASIYIGIDAN